MPPGSRGRDQLLLGTGTLHPATLSAGSDAVVPQFRCPSAARQPAPTSGSQHCLLARQEEKEERGCASSVLYIGLTCVLL